MAELVYAYVSEAYGATLESSSLSVLTFVTFPLLADRSWFAVLQWLQMSLIQNKKELLSANSELRSDAFAILEAGLEAINTEKILREKITMHDGAFCMEGMGFQCSFYERIFFIGIGKCAFEGARVIESILGESLTDGIVLDVKTGILKRIKSYAGTHPYPSEANMNVTRQILSMVQGVTERDLVLVLISGGGSSLLCLPHEINCESLVKITEELTQKGADIYELNTVRKHLSEVQGGGLAKMLYPAQVVSLIFSDVIGNDISVIASGPTVKDQTTYEDAQKVLEKYQLKIPNLLETPKEDKYFNQIKNFLIASNIDALEAMRKKADSMGYTAKIESATLSGSAPDVGRELAAIEMETKVCLLFGGETTVKVVGGGKGGRNQELALAALPYLKNDTVLLAAASDGWDNTDHAGAIVDADTLFKAQSLGFLPQKYSADNNSYKFFEEVGGAICTGRLESNVSDLCIILSR